MQLKMNDMLGLKQEYDECLKKCLCLELIQIKDIQITADKQAYLEVRATRSSFTQAKLSSNILFIG